MVKMAKIVKNKSERRALAEASERLESLFSEIPFIRLKGSKTDVKFGNTQVISFWMPSFRASLFSSSLRSRRKESRVLSGLPPSS